MMRFIILTVMLLALSGFAHANDVTVKGGEHPGFTRVVMDFETLPDWEARQVGRSQRITFSDANLRFDISRAFRLIGRERVGDIRLIDSGLEFDIACDCSFSVRHVAENAIAAEVRPRGSSKRAQTADMEALEPPEIKKDVVSLPRIKALERMPKPTMGDSPKRDGLFETPRVLHFERNLLAPGLDDALQQRSQSVAIELLGRQLSRAVAQGLVDADPNILSRSPPELHSISELKNRSNLSVSTGIDRAINPNLDNIPPTAAGAICVPNSLVNVNSWGEISDPQALGKHRSAAIAEDGGLESDGAIKLARFYIAMGFGAEAKMVASHLDDKNREILSALGNIIDVGFSDSALFNGQIQCDGIVALWAMLARPDSTELPENTDIVLATFSSLAPHLRSHLGPLLSETFRDAGRNEAARSVINAMTRGGDVTGKSALATARLNLESSLAEQARDTLTDLSEGTDVTAAEALLELLKDAEDRQMAPNPAWVTDDVPSLVRAIEGTEVAAELNIAGLRGKIALGMFEDFRKELAQSGPGLDAASRVELAKQALAEAVMSASSEDFLKTEVGLSRILNRKGLPVQMRLRISERLLALGLPKRALEYLVKNPGDDQERKLKARVYLERDDPDAAIGLLEGRQSTASQLELLAEAYRRRGDDRRAISVFSSTDNEKAALASAFRSGVWEWVAESENAQISSPVRDLFGPIEAQSTNVELIESSRHLRDQARALLDLASPTVFEELFTN